MSVLKRTEEALVLEDFEEIGNIMYFVFRDHGIQVSFERPETILPIYQGEVKEGKVVDSAIIEKVKNADPNPELGFIKSFNSYIHET